MLHPSRFSNIGLSLFEDVAVVGGLALIHFNPRLGPGSFRSSPFDYPLFCPQDFSSRARQALADLEETKRSGRRRDNLRSPVDLAFPLRLGFLPREFVGRDDCLGGALHREDSPRCAGQFFRPAGRDKRGFDQTHFSSRAKAGVARGQVISLDGCVTAREPKFLSENLVISPETGKAALYLFLFSSAVEGRVCNSSWSF